MPPNVLHSQFCIPPIVLDSKFCMPLIVLDSQFCMPPYLLDNQFCMPLIVSDSQFHVPTIVPDSHFFLWYQALSYKINIFYFVAWVIYFGFSIRKFGNYIEQELRSKVIGLVVLKYLMRNTSSLGLSRGAAVCTLETDSGATISKRPFHELEFLVGGGGWMGV